MRAEIIEEELIKVAYREGGVGVPCWKGSFPSIPSEDVCMESEGSTE
jgi:hypothetical protein